MNKKILLLLSLLLCACLLSGCTMFPPSRLEAMFRDTTEDSAAAQENGDTVTISRELYEQYQQFDELLELMDAADAYYVKDPDHQEMLYGAAAGLLAGLGDPYTFYYDPKAYQQMQEDDEGVYAGIGVMISGDYRTGLCTITRVFKGSPSEAAGVMRGDILYKVGDDLTVTAENLQEAVDIMRGIPGTQVDVTFIRGTDEIRLTLSRAMVHVNQVESTLLEDGIGYIALYQFAGECDKEFEAALNDLTAKGAKGIIIDLRDNPGGWTDAAENIADLFLDAGEIYYLKYRGGYEEHTYRSKKGRADVKLVMLVNENSASSSEILTGALKDRAGATVVGVNTFGKGIVQAVLPVGDKGAGFQITIAEYFTPSGYAVHEKGIAPDVEVPLKEGDKGMYDFADTANDYQLSTAVETMRKKLNGETR